MDPPEQPIAKEVGDAFVNQYYLVMQSNPHLLYKFYRDHSYIGRPGQDGRIHSSTFADIDDNLNVITSGGFDSVELTSVISQNSLCGSVCVSVCGYFTLNETLKRNFNQHFFLVPQTKGHFVLNDMFRFGDDKPIRPDDNVIEEKVPETEDTHKETADDSKIADASVVIKPIYNVQGQRWSCNLFPKINYDACDTFDTGEGSNQRREAIYESAAVCVQNLPSYYTFDNTMNAFRKFGEIKRLKIRNPKMDCYYGFVKFHDANAAERAIKASPVRIDGRYVYVEKKRVTDFREKMKIFEEEGRQHGVNRYRSKHLRERGVYDFWDWVESMGIQSRRQEGDRGTRDYDYWEWQKEVDYSWDYEQAMEEHKKFEEEQRKLAEEEETKLN